MSIKVALEDLGETIARFRFAYLLTVREDARTHITAAYATLVDGTLVVRDAGRTTRANVGIHPSVTLLWPPLDARDYSLIVDGQATARPDDIAIVPTWAVLHRPAPS